MKNVIDSIDKYNKKKNLETELYKAFNESYSNDKFKRLVDKLKLNIEVLSKYTSELEESSIEYDHCLNCKGLIECKNKICGYAYLPNKKDKWKDCNGASIFFYMISCILRIFVV